MATAYRGLVQVPDDDQEIQPQQQPLDPNVIGGDLFRPGTNTGINGRASDYDSGVLAPSPAPVPSPSPSPSPSGGYNLEAFRKAWTQPGVGSQTSMADLQAFLAARPDITQGVTLQGEKAYDPSGNFIADLIGNYSGGDPSGMTRIFLDGIDSNTGLPRTASGSGSAVAGAGAGSGSMAPLPGAASGLAGTLTQSLMQQFGGATTNAQNAEMEAALRASILQLLGQGSQSGLPDTGSSPQAQQFRLSSTREADRARSQAMESRAQTGLLHSGPAEGDIEGIQQARAESQARFEVGLTQQLLTERQQKLALALQTGAGMLNAEQDRALRAELAAVDAALQQNRLKLDWQQTQNQNQQFYDDLGFRIGDREAYWNSQTAGAML